MPSENKTRSEFTNHCKHDEFDPTSFLWLRTALKIFCLQIFNIINRQYLFSVTNG